MAFASQENSVKYQVRITAKAEQDVESVLSWFDSQGAGAAGSRWFAQLMTRITVPETRPERRPIAMEAEELGVLVRELLFGRRQGTYRILFQITGRTVQILRVWHAARNALSAADL
jgi:hypothetical protein